jgi:DNA topoisomerase-1
MMIDAFPQIVDVNFTSNMEALLDGIAEGDVKWKTVIENFYPDLDKAVKAAEEALEKVQVQDEVTDEICEVCGRNLVIKYGPHGKFLACPGFPECKNTKPYFEKIGVSCPKCGKDIVLKRTKKGRIFYGCIDNPNCDFMSWQRPAAKKCPKCGGVMYAKNNKLACGNPECGWVEDKDNKENN